MTEDAIIFTEFDGDSERILTVLKNILHHVETQVKEGYMNGNVLLEILPVVDLVEEPMYSLIVAQNICGIREKSSALLERFDNLQSIGVLGLDD